MQDVCDRRLDDVCNNDLRRWRWIEKRCEIEMGVGFVDWEIAEMRLRMKCGERE